MQSAAERAASRLAGAARRVDVRSRRVDGVGVAVFFAGRCAERHDRPWSSPPSPLVPV